METITLDASNAFWGVLITLSLVSSGMFLFGRWDQRRDDRKKKRDSDIVMRGFAERYAELRPIGSRSDNPFVRPSHLRPKHPRSTRDRMKAMVKQGCDVRVQYRIDAHLVGKWECSVTVYYCDGTSENRVFTYRKLGVAVKLAYRWVVDREKNRKLITHRQRLGGVDRGLLLLRGVTAEQFEQACREWGEAIRDSGGTSVAAASENLASVWRGIEEIPEEDMPVSKWSE